MARRTGGKARRRPARQRFSVVEIGALEPALEGRTGYLTTFWDEAGEYYAPPVNLDQLTLLLRVNAHHESAIHCKRNTVMLGYRPGDPAVVSRTTMAAAAFDYILYGNAYLRRRVDQVGRLLRLEHLHARTIRRKKEADRYCQVLPDRTIDFGVGEVIHVKMYAPESSVYGLPEYLGALGSLLLNEQATLFRRKYYVNGAHLGFILFTQGRDIEEEMIEEVQQKVKEAKGVGNFKSLYLHFDGDGQAKLLPVGDFAKDDFEKVKTISRDDIISAHRVPPQILAVLTDNKQPQGDLDKAVNLYNSNVVRPLQLDLTDEINQHLPESQQIAFDPYAPPGTGAPEAPAQEARP